MFNFEAQTQYFMRRHLEQKTTKLHQTVGQLSAHLSFTAENTLACEGKAQTETTPALGSIYLHSFLAELVLQCWLVKYLIGPFFSY